MPADPFETITLPQQEWSFFKQPVYAWRCELFGCGSQMVLQREEGKQPRWFWRKMQYLILGNRWTRLPPTPSATKED